MIRLLLTFIFILSPALMAADTEDNCTQALSRPDKASYYPTELMSFAEVFAPLGNWQASTNGQVDIQHDPHPQKSTVTFTNSDSSSPATFYLQVPRSEQFLNGGGRHRPEQRISQEAGSGLKLKIKASHKSQKVKIRLLAFALNLDDIWSGNYDNGRTVIAEAEVEVPTESQLIYIPWEQFTIDRDLQIQAHEYARTEGRPLSSVNAYKPISSSKYYDYKAGSAFDPTVMEIAGYQFIIENDQTNTSSLEIEGSIYRDFSMEWLDAQKTYSGVIEAFEFSLPGTGIDRSVFKQMVKRYSNPDAIDYAMNKISQGEEAIAAELKKYKAYLVEQPDGKIEPVDFFNQFASTNRVSFVEDPERNLPVPIEQGRFAEHHSRFAHAAQVLMLYFNTTERERREFNKMFSVIGSRTFIWENLWNVFFDAPGADGPNAPLWWAEEFRRRGITADPAGQL